MERRIYELFWSLKAGSEGFWVAVTGSCTLLAWVSDFLTFIFTTENSLLEKKTHPWQEGQNLMVFKVPSNPNDPMIPQQVILGQSLNSSG